MDAVVRSVRRHTKSLSVQRQLLRCIRRVIEYARAESKLRVVWDESPSSFSINPVLHRVPANGQEQNNSEEPFRFVPQPIIDWVMDHLHLLTMKTDYKTAEARVMIYLQERCGRRTSETVSLRDDCISYDSDGAPYLEWQQGKPPYGRGPRLPIHQETHDAIDQWKSIKRSRGIESQWLFPSTAWAVKDAHYQAEVLQANVRRLIKEIKAEAPYASAVEGSEGNLLNFDLDTIDAYAFRHGFAQRLADAVDENGRSTTPPDVLQSYMGHKSFRTTMGYYQVTAKRRRRALSSLPARKLDVNGQQIETAPERDSYRRVGLTIGSCSEPQNVASNGRSCALDHACESCPFFLVDPLDREGIVAKRTHLEVQKERAAVINSPGYYLQFLDARIADCDSVVDGIDRYVQQLPTTERELLMATLAQLEDVRRRAEAPRMLDLRQLLKAG